MKKNGGTFRLFTLIFCRIILFSTLLFPLISSYNDTSRSYAESMSAQEADVVFVLDNSFSMNQTDQDRIALEVIHMFMDMSEAARTRFGLIAYNDRIVASQPLSAKSGIKREIEGLRRSGYSDLGLGLREGAKLLSDSASSERSRLLILLSDGDIELGASSGQRKLQDSESDVAKALEQAKQEGYPIYTVGLNSNGSVREERLRQIAAETGGSAFITDSADDLPEIFNQIFAAHIQSVLIPVAAVTANGQLQEVTVEVPNSSMTELNLLMLSSQPVSESHLYFSSRDVQLYTSDKYVLMKIAEPRKEKLQLKFRGKAGDFVKINLLGSYNVQGEFHIADGSKPIKGQPVPVEAWLTQPGEDTKRLTDQDVYASMTAELRIEGVDRKSSPPLAVPMVLKEDRSGFTVNYTFPAAGSYRLSVHLNGSDFYRRTAVQTLELPNLAPQAQAPASPLRVVKSDGSMRVQLHDYFTDPNNDELQFAAMVMDGEALQIAVEQGELIVTPLRAGSTRINVTATDTDGASVEAELSFQVSAPWSIYAVIALVTGLVLAAGAALYIVFRPKPAFFGRLEGYFLETASGNDIPVKYWPLHTLGTRRSISLEELFGQLEVHEIVPEAKDIWFKPGKEHTLLVRHDTKCTVVIGRTPLPAGSTGRLAYNDKLYITFEDHVTEIELRYKEPKPNAR